jgi:hypothetical protein
MMINRLLPRAARSRAGRGADLRLRFASMRVPDWHKKKRSIMEEKSNLPPNAPKLVARRKYSFLRQTLGKCRKSCFFQSGA